MNSYQTFLKQLAALKADAMVTSEGILQIQTVPLPDPFDLVLNNAADDGAFDHDCAYENGYGEDGCNHPCHEQTNQCIECGDEIADMGMPRRCKSC